MFEIMVSLLMENNAMALTKVDIAQAAIVNMQPKLSNSDAKTIAKSLLLRAHKHNLDWRMMAAIISQESSFRRDPQRCSSKKSRCADLGLTQINRRTWTKKMNLDEKRLLTDVDYSIETMAQILSNLKSKYGNEKKWYTRFHSFTPKHRRIYDSYINNKYIAITKYAQGFEDAYTRLVQKRICKWSPL